MQPKSINTNKYTNDVISSFKGIKNKQNFTFFSFDIKVSSHLSKKYFFDSMKALLFHMLFVSS